MVMGMRARKPMPTFVGERTWGCMSDMMTGNLPIGAAMSLSNQRYTDLNGTCYEAVGLPLTNGAKNVVSVSNRSDAGGHDPAIARATEILMDAANLFQYKRS